MEIKAKINEMKANAKKKAWEICHDGTIWYYNHEEDVRKMAPIVVGALTVAGKAAWKNHKYNKEIRDIACRHYDRRLDEYFYSTRPLKANEVLKLAEMYNAKISKGEALRAMGLLRY